MLSSYNRFHTNVFRDVWIIAAVDLLTSLFMSALVFAATGFACSEMGLQLEQFKLQGESGHTRSTSLRRAHARARASVDGVQLVFVFFAEAVAKLPVAPLNALLFFLMVALIIFNTELFLVETIVSSICDQFPERLRRNHRHVLTFVLCFFYLLTLPLCSTVSRRCVA